MSLAHNDELRALLAGCARRDESAFARLYETTAPKLFAVAVRMLRREDWAEEVLQDFYVSMWNNATSYSEGLSAPMTWMMSIVRNRCLDWLRRPRIEVQVDGYHTENDASFFDSVASDAPVPHELIESASDSRALARCMGLLDQRYREVIVLAFYEGLTHTELAARVAHPLGTVKTWVRRGLEQLKGCLGTPPS